MHVADQHSLFSIEILQAGCVVGCSGKGWCTHPSQSTAPTKPWHTPIGCLRVGCTLPCVQISWSGKAGSRSSSMHGLKPLKLCQSSHPTPLPPPNHTHMHGMTCRGTTGSFPKDQLTSTNHCPFCPLGPGGGRLPDQPCMHAYMHACTCMHA